MKIKFVISYCSLLIAFFSGNLEAQNSFSALNLSYHYNPKAEIQLQSKLARNQDSLFVFLKIGTLTGVGLTENYTISYGFLSDFSQMPNFNDTIDFNKQLKSTFRNDYFLALSMPFNFDQNYLVFKIQNNNTQNEYFYDLKVSNDEDFPVTSYIFYNQTTNEPVWNRFINKNDTIAIRSFADEDQFTGFTYNVDFNAAEPPMAVISQNVQEKISVDSSFNISRNNDFNLNGSKLLFVQADTNSLSGISVRVEDMFYPKLARVDEVIEPLLYITTRGEKQALLGASVKKKALDKFWLQVARTPQRAKTIIKMYFNRIEAANRYFTNYKQGWKTDQGMVYGIYGAPDIVHREGEQEQWIYNKTEDLPKLSFKFLRVKNMLSDHHYSLIKDEEYELYWHRAIDLLRKGRQNT
ncbi:MAG: GWxTD domain-containing protein [Cyclobacteriaceae bacterium]